ncbi:MAG: copper homeostasis protein CutC, partial [Sediminibacterium sp.]|nr:copper homeostasis protein CutC [Sediminibacterium sp.]
GGDFLYSGEEFDVIKKDILLCKELGFEGVVTGALTADGNIHAEQTKRFVELAYPMELTFHRAFDRAADPLAALEILIGCGCSRMLTSGQVPGAFDGKELLKTLVTQASDRIIVMPGSGVRSSNIAALAQFTGATEMHSSARKIQPTQMQYLQASMNEKLNTVTVDAGEIASMKSQLHAL